MSHDDSLRDALTHAISRRMHTPVTVRALKQVAGGASQEAWSLDVDVMHDRRPQCVELILRRDMGGALSSAVLPRAQEFAVLDAVSKAGVNVPNPFWFIPGDELGVPGRDAFLMTRLHGETIGRRIVQDPRLAAARALLPRQLGSALAAIHAVPWESDGLHFLVQPGRRSAADVALERLTADLDAVDEPHPALEVGLQWLRAHDPGPSETVLLHGDFRIGNIMVAEDGLRGILDWESAHLGDPHEDLAWPSVRAWRFAVDHQDFGGIAGRAPFIEAYEQASGRTVDPVKLRYWEVLGNARWAVGALGQARRHLNGLERSIELASLGRIAAEMELEMLRLIRRTGQELIGAG